MTSDQIRTLVNGQTCQIDGVRYEFTATGIGTEKYCDPALPSHVLEVECVAAADSDDDSVRFHFLVWVDDLSELPGLLKDALIQCLSERRLSSRVGDQRRSRRRSWRQALRDAAKSA